MGELFKAAAFAHPRSACRPDSRASQMLQAASLAARPHPPWLLYPQRRRVAASMPASTAASAQRRRPTMSPKTARAWRRRSASRRTACSPPIRSIRPTWWSPTRRGRPRTARVPTPSSPARRARDRRVHRRLRTAAVRRSEAGVIGAAHAGWRGALTGVIEATVAAMEVLGAERGQIVRRSAPPSASRITRSGPNSSRALPPRRANAGSSPAAARRPRHVRSRRLYCRAGATRRHRAVRGSRAVHLCRARTLFQLPPHHQAKRARLRPAYQRHRARNEPLERAANAFGNDSRSLGRN